MQKAIPPKGYTSLHEGKVHGVSVLLWGDEANKTAVYRFFDGLEGPEAENSLEDLMASFDFIDRFFPDNIHKKKFKPMGEEDFWEVKGGDQLRFASIWDRNRTLILIYGLWKKDQQWRKEDLRKARAQYKLYQKERKS